MHLKLGRTTQATSLPSGYCGKFIFYSFTVLLLIDLTSHIRTGYKWILHVIEKAAQVTHLPHAFIFPVVSNRLLNLCWYLTYAVNRSCGNMYLLTRLTSLLPQEINLLFFLSIVLQIPKLKHRCAFNRLHFLFNEEEFCSTSALFTVKFSLVTSSAACQLKQS